jgi:hypothetical protein
MLRVSEIEIDAVGEEFMLDVRAGHLRCRHQILQFQHGGEIGLADFVLHYREVQRILGTFQCVGRVFLLVFQVALIRDCDLNVIKCLRRIRECR